MKLLSLPEMSLYGAVLIAAVLLLRAAFLNRLPKRTFSTLWGLAILRLLLPFSVASAVSLYALLPAALPAPEPLTADEPALAPAPAVSAPAPAVTVSPTPVPTAAASPIITSTEPSPFPETVPVTVTAAEPIQTEAPKAELSLETVLKLIWCSGAALLLLVFAAVYLRGRREFRMSLPIQNDFIEAWQKSCPLRRKVTVRCSDRISAPLTYGVFCPVILLPDPIGTDEKTLEHILTHELVHIRRFDAVKKPLCALAVCLHWFNPLVWIMFFLFTRDLELACDEGAVRQLGIGGRSDYAKTLIGMEARKSGFLPFFSHFAGFAAEERIKAIMKLKKTSVITSIAAVLLVCGTAGVFLTSAAAKPEEETALTDREKAIREMEEYRKRIEELIAEAQNSETSASSEEERIAKNYASRIDVLKNEENDLLIRYQEAGERQAALEEEIKQAEARLAEYQAVLAAAQEDGSSDPHDVQQIAEECEKLEKEKNDLLAEFQNTAERRATLEKRIEQTEVLLAEYEAALQKIFYEWEWWTAEEYEKWIEEQEKELESLIGTGSGYYDKQGEFHTFTRENVDATIGLYRATLEQIKNGVKVSKPSYDGAILMQSITKDGEQELEKSLRLYVPFGIRIQYDETDGETKMFYRGKEVRALYDETAGLFISNHAGLWNYGEDALDLYAVYTDGVLTGVREATEAEREENTAVRRANTQAWLLEQDEITDTVETAYIAEGHVMTPEQEKARIDGLFAEYARFGLTRDESGKVYFHGKPVRIFFDGVDHLEEIAMISRYTYLNEEGEIDVRTLWTPKDNGDGSVDPFGTMIGIEETKSLNLNDFRAFERSAVTETEETVSDVIPKVQAGSGSGADPTSVSVIEADSTAQTALAQGNSAGGMTIPDIFEKYAPFGITYDKAEGNVYLNGKLVRTFVDSSGRGVFTYQSRNVEGRETVDVRVVYENGRIVSVREMTEAEKNANFSEQPAENYIFKLKELDSPDISEALAKQPAAPLKEKYMANLDTYNGLGNALRFIAPGGEEVYSVADGTVVFSQYTGGFGRTVVIRSADGTCWGYCHLDLDLPAGSLGETVKAGDVIGYVGTSGWTTGNALHLFLADGSDFGNGTLLTESPLRGSYFMSEDFGRISENLFHNGIDLTATGIAGAEIHAFADGTILEAGFDNSNGNYLLIDHGNGLQSFYAHCKELYVRAGETVGKGDVIAAVGSSGYATGPHLHFELRKDGTPIDPKPYLNIS